MKQGVQLITATAGAEVEAVVKKAILVKEENEDEEVLNGRSMKRRNQVLNDDRSSNHGQLCVTVDGCGSNTVSVRIM